MRYLRSVITRLFTRVVGRVAVGYLADPGCLDEAGTHPEGQGMDSSGAFFISSVSILRIFASPISGAAFFQRIRSD